jgi:hypothetical protein
MIDDEKQGFIDLYRDYMDSQRDTAFQDIENARRNQFQGIMSGANKLGMMYSNFPERSMYQYDTSTYKPALIKAQQTYQTGLDSLRSNLASYINQLAEINEATNDLNESAKVAQYTVGDKDTATMNYNGDKYTFKSTPTIDENGNLYYDITGVNGKIDNNGVIGVLPEYYEELLGRVVNDD